MQKVANIIYSQMRGTYRPERLMIEKELFMDFQKEIRAHYKAREEMPISGSKADAEGLRSYLYMGVEICLENKHD